MGLFKKSKPKVDEKPKLTCKLDDSGSYKCIFLASYRKVPINIEWAEPSEFDDKLSESLNFSNLMRFPHIKDGEFTICGENPVLTYLNIKGGTPTIHPRKARVLAMQEYWIQVLTRNFTPLLNNDSKNKEKISSILNYFDSNLSNKNYIVGELSLADIHWAAVFKLLEDEGREEIFNSFTNITNWLENLKIEIPGYEINKEEIVA